MFNQFIEIMKKIVCRRDYHKYGTSSLDTFVIEVRNGIYTNSTTFSTPPFPDTDYETVQEKYNNAASDYAQYGLTKKIAFIDAKNEMIQTLDTLATYVDTLADGNVSTIALSGFVPTSDTVHPSAPLGKIDSFEISFVKDDVIKYTYTVGNGITLNANEMKFSFIGGITNIDEGDYTCYVRWTSSLYGVNDIARFFMKVLPNNF